MPRRRRSRKPFPTELFKEAYSGESSDTWWVYVLQSQVVPPGKKVGYTYVGATNDPVRRLKQHNGLLPGGAKYTSRYRMWRMKALYGPYSGRRNALRAEYALKHGKRGVGRMNWSSEDSPWCKGDGTLDPRLPEINKIGTSDS